MNVLKVKDRLDYNSITCETVECTNIKQPLRTVFNF